MSTSQDQKHGFLEDQHIFQSPVPPVLRTYLSPLPARSYEVRQRRQCLRSPMIPVVRSPGFRLYLSPSFARPMDTRRRASPSVPAGAHTSVDIPAGAHTSVDIPAGAHTSVGLPSKSRKIKLTSDIWEDFNAIYDEKDSKNPEDTRMYASESQEEVFHEEPNLYGAVEGEDYDIVYGGEFQESE